MGKTDQRTVICSVFMFRLLILASHLGSAAGTIEEHFESNNEKVIHYSSDNNAFHANIFSPQYADSNSNDNKFSSSEEATVKVVNLPAEKVWIKIEDIPSTLQSFGCRHVPYHINTSTTSSLQFVSECDDSLRILNRIVANIHDLLIILPSQTDAKSFRIHLSIYKNIASLSSVDTQVVDIHDSSSNSGYITSHDTFYTKGNDALYSPNSVYQLSLRIPPTTTTIHLTYQAFNIGNKDVSDCQTYTGDDQDKFTIQNGDIPLYKCRGGSHAPGETTFNILSPENTLNFKLTTINNIYKGFLIHYRVVSCDNVANAIITRIEDSHNDFQAICVNSRDSHDLECENGEWKNTVNCGSPQTSTSHHAAESTTTNESETQTKQQESFTKPPTPDTRNNLTVIIAASAGGGGVLLLIIIILLAVLICRRNRKSDDESISRARTSGAYNGMALSEQTMNSEPRGRQYNGEVNSGAYSSVDLEGDDMKSSIAVVAPNNSMARYNTASSTEDVPGLGNIEDDEQYANRETITRDRAQQGGTGDIYASILSSTKIKSTAPRHAAVEVAMVDNDLYGGVE